MKIKLLLFVCFTIVVSCTKEDIVTVNDPFLSVYDKSQDLSLAQIQQLASELPGMFNSDLQTKSGNTGSVTNLIPFNEVKLFKGVELERTKKEATENIYVVNYADNNGFAIISADAKMENILAYSDTGNITDTMSNPGVKLFMNLVAQYASDPLLDSMPEEERYPDQTEVITGEEYTQVGPYVDVRWGQATPFNDAIPVSLFLTGSNYSNEKPPAGCVAIALLQIMAANSYPSSFWVPNGAYSCNWDMWNTYTYGYNFPDESYDRRAIAALTYEIGKAVEMKYGYSGSSSSIEKADKALRNTFGYTTDGVYSYSTDRVMSDLYQGYPLYVRGDATDNWIGSNNGHAWVIDGYKDVYKIYTIYNNYYDEFNNLTHQECAGTRSAFHTRWLHCNYGWNGDGNGYYYSGVFNTELPVEEDDINKPTGTGYYRYKLEVIKNIRPQ